MLNQAAKLPGCRADPSRSHAKVFPEQTPTTLELGIYPQLAALETIIYPASSQLLANVAPPFW